MQFSFLQIPAIIFTYLIFGFLGFRISARIKRPVSMLVWIVLVIATLAAPFIMPGATLVGAGNVGIYINFSLQAIGLGMIIGLSTREIRIKFGDKGSS